MLFPRATEEVTHTAPAETSAPPAPSLSGVRVLVADDEPSVLEVARTMLESLGFEVAVASNGREAVDAVGADPSSLRVVLLDLTMPVLGGVGAFHEIRALAPHVPVVLMSGNTEQDAAEELMRSGLAACIQKPFTLATLADRLRGVLEQDAR